MWSSSDSSSESTIRVSGSIAAARSAGSGRVLWPARASTTIEKLFECQN